MKKLWDVKHYPMHMRMDVEKHNDNVRKRFKLCPRCEGTGNEFVSMFSRCKNCKGTGIKK